MPLVMLLLCALFGFGGVAQAAVTGLTANPVSPSTFGQSVTFTATVTVNTSFAWGTVGFTDGGTPITGCTAVTPTGSSLLNRPATCTTSALTASGSSRVIRATQSGAVSVPNIVFPNTVLGAYNAINYLVNQSATTTTITSDPPDPSVVGQAVTVNYTVAPVAPGAGTPTGNVTVTDGTVSCTGTVAAGTCILTPNFTTVGTKTLTATYAGDSNFLTSTSIAETHTVNQAATTTTITSDNPDPSVVGQAVTVAYTVVANAPGAGTPTGSVTVTDGTVSCTDTVAAGTCILTPNFTTAGAKTLTATYAGDTNFNGSTSANEPHTVNQATTTTTITSDTPDPSLVNQPVVVNYTVVVNAPGAGTPTGNVTVTVTGPVNNNSCTATVGAGTCTLPGTDFPLPGSYTLTATYAGDNNFSTSFDIDLHQVSAVGPGGAAGIPTLQEWALMLFGLLLGGLVWRQSQRKGRMAA